MSREDQDEYSEEEEDVLIYVDFEEFSKEPIENKTTFKVLGLDTEKPILQLGSNIYEGEYTSCFGTYLFFEKDDNPKPTIKSVSKAEPHTYYKFSEKTDKVLHMKRIFVREKDSEEHVVQDPTLKFPETYEEALQELGKLAENDLHLNVQT